jgi:hypothetical protein
MLRWAIRFLVFRFLPRRLFWVLTVLDAFFLVRALGRRLLGPTRVNSPLRSRTAPPALPPPAAADQSQATTTSSTTSRPEA